MAGPSSRSGLRNNPGRVTHQMEIDFYLITRWRNIFLHLTGACCGKGVLQTAGKSWALASLLLGQWKITKKARLPSALLRGSFWAPENTERNRKRRDRAYLGRRGVWEAAGAGAAAAAGAGAGTGRRVDSCRSPWSRTSGAHRASPAEMGTGAQEEPVRPLGAQMLPAHRSPQHTSPPPALAGRTEAGLAQRKPLYGRLAWKDWRARFHF